MGELAVKEGGGIRCGTRLGRRRRGGGGCRGGRWTAGDEGLVVGLHVARGRRENVRLARRRRGRDG